MSLPPRVLLVDDNLDTRELYAFALRQAGYDVREAADGPSAIADAPAHPPSIVVTDIRMPGHVSAVDLCRHFRAHDIQVIVVTGVPDGPEQEAIRRAGCALLVMKPYAPDVLCRDVARILADDAAPHASSA